MYDVYDEPLVHIFGPVDLPWMYMVPAAAEKAEEDMHKFESSVTSIDNLIGFMYNSAEGRLKEILMMDYNGKKWASSHKKEL